MEENIIALDSLTVEDMEILNEKLGIEFEINDGQVIAYERKEETK